MEYDKIPCPKCGEITADETDFEHVSYWGESHELSCLECGHDFIVIETVTRTYEIKEDS